MFYFVWGNCLVAFAFLISTFFRSTRTAVVVAYLWVIATGLLGYLLFQNFVERKHWWTWWLELIPTFSLYRGLYELSQYAFRANYTHSKALTWSGLNDPDNGMSVAMGIMALEWAVFLLFSWYFDQTLPTGM